MTSTVPVLSAVLILLVAFAGCTEPIDSKAAGAEKISGSTNTGAATLANGTGGLLRMDKQSFEGTILVGTQDAAGAATGCGDVGQDMVDQMTFDWVIVDKEADGTASVVKRAILKLAATTPTALDIDLFVLSPSGEQVASATSGDPAETVEIKDPLKAGTYQLRVTACNLAAIQFTLGAEAEYYAV